MIKLRRLLVAYCLVAATAFVAYHGSKWLTGKLHPHSTLSRGRMVTSEGRRVIEEERMVEEGKVNFSLYGEQVWWYSTMLFFLATVWALREDDRTAYESTWEYLLTSKKVNMMVGVLFIFATLGLLFGKGGHVVDPVVIALLLFSPMALAVIFARFIARGIYLRRIARTGLASNPTSGSGRAISS